MESFKISFLEFNIENFQKPGSNDFVSLKRAYADGGREIITYIEYGYYLEIDIEILGLNHLL